MVPEINLAQLLEAYLFVAVEPVAAGEIARVLCAEVSVVEEALEGLVAEYAQREDSGLQIVRIAGGYQMATQPALSEGIARLLAAPGSKARLSKPALETLAIIAYQQPITQAEIETIRGVGIAAVLKTLADRALIKEEGRKPVVGRPILYATTSDFLHYFGLNKLDDLPPLAEIAADEAEQDHAAAHEALEAVGLGE